MISPLEPPAALDPIPPVPARARRGGASALAFSLLVACGSSADPEGIASSPLSPSASASAERLAASSSASAAPSGMAASPSDLELPAGPGSLAPSLQTVGGDVLATWLERPGGLARRLVLSRLHEGRWSAPVTIAEGEKIVASWADVPRIAPAVDGSMVASWAEATGLEGETYDAIVARSLDGGATWKRVGRLHADTTRAEHGFVTLVPDDGAVRAFWLDGREAGRPGGTTQLRTALVGDTVQGEVVVDAAVCDCCQTAGASTPSGAIVAYRDRTSDEVRDVWFARRDGAAWVSAGVAKDGWSVAGCPVNGPSMASGEGLLALAWYTYAESTHRVRVAFSRDHGATFGPPVEVDAPEVARSPIGRASVIVDGDTAIVGWMASDREEASVLVRRVSAAGASGPEVRLAKSIAGRDGGFPRLARTPQDLVAAWTEAGPPSRVRAIRLPLRSVPATGSTPRAQVAPTAVPGPGRVGHTVPDLALRSLDGKAVELSSLRGRVVLVNVWATWCEPCRHELPTLAALHTRHEGKGLTVVGVNVDRDAQQGAVESFVARRKLPFPVWLDADDRVPSALGVTTYPANLLLGRDGKIRWRRDGAIRADDPELGRAIEEALAAR